LLDEQRLDIFVYKLYLEKSEIISGLGPLQGKAFKLRYCIKETLDQAGRFKT
jgi:hypothetical protein